MSKSIQERLKHLEHIVKTFCNRFFKLKEQVDSLQTQVDSGLSLETLYDVSIPTPLEENQTLLYQGSTGEFINKSVFDAIDSKSTFGNVNYPAISSDRFITTSVLFTAPRNITLPLANSVNAGHEIIIADGAGAINGTNTLTILRAGSNLINGATSETISATFGIRRLISNGVNAWNFDGGVARLGGATFTGNISAPNFKGVGLQTLTGVVWTGTTAPSGTANLSYQWQRDGNLVTASFVGIYTVAGSLLTAVRFPLPTDMPTPLRPTGVATTASHKSYVGLGHISTSALTLGTTTQSAFIVNNATDTTKFDVTCGASSLSALTFYITVSYFTS